MSLYDGLAFELIPTVRDGRQCVRLLKDYRVRGLTVPAGFVSDWASVPWWLDGIVPSFGPYAPAAIAHDWLYERGGVSPYLTRKQADELFLDLLAELRVPWWKRSLMFRAVRLGGASGWAKR